MSDLSGNKSKISSEGSIDEGNVYDGLQRKYTELLKKHYENLPLLETNAQLYIKENNYTDPLKWMEALAVCEVSLQKDRLTDIIKELYRQIYSKSWNKHVSVEFDELDYQYWFDLNKKINNLFIEKGHNRGYAEQADLYSSVRRPYRDMDKMREYYLKGVEVNDPASLGCYGYGVYYGIPGYGEVNKEEGLRMILKSKELGYESVDLLLLHLEFYNNDELAELAARLIKTEA